MKHIIIALALCLLPSCLTPAQFDTGMNRIFQEQDRSRLAIEQSAQEFREGTITLAQHLENMRLANENSGKAIIDTVDGFAKDVKDNVATGVEVGSGLFGDLTGTEVLGSLATLLLGGYGLKKTAEAGAAKRVNLERDLARRLRGEPVSGPPA